jgi:hypothetical protein
MKLSFVQPRPELQPYIESLWVLSAFHDYPNKDPFDSLTPEQRNDITQYLRSYHAFAMDSATKFRDIERVLPGVFDKISGNLECYVKAIEEDSDLTE